MIMKIKRFFSFNKTHEPTTDFSAFFHNASSAEKKKLLEGVVREANKDQRDLVSKYEATRTIAH